MRQIAVSKRTLPIRKLPSVRLVAPAYQVKPGKRAVPCRSFSQSRILFPPAPRGKTARLTVVLLHFQKVSNLLVSGFQLP